MNILLDHEEEAIFNLVAAQTDGSPARIAAWQKVLDAIDANDLAAYQSALAAAQALDDEEATHE